MENIENFVYLDNAATTKPCTESIKAVNECLETKWGNPSSLHKKGIEAQLPVDNARKIIASSIGCDVSEIYFTSCATESTNLAIFGTAAALGRNKKKIVTTTIEHSSVKNCLDNLAQSGYEIVKISPDKNGIINFADIVNAVDENTCLVSIMLVNNETGYILPVKKAFTFIKKKYPSVNLHCDCVQAYMKINVRTDDIPADIMSFSAHKIHGVKGAGFIYIRKGTKIKPYLIGGGQEKGIRGGTESVPLIAGMAKAVEVLMPDIKQRFEKVTDLRSYLLQKLSSLDGIAINSDENCLPYIVNISLIGYRSEIILHYLEDKGIYISSGSACSKGAKSGVLTEFGISPERADSALRISFCAENTLSDIDRLINALSQAQKDILKK